MPTASTYAYITRKASGKAIIEGTRISVGDIAALAEAGLSVDSIGHEYETLTRSQIYSALAYDYDHRDEVAADRRRAEERAEDLQRRFPNQGSPT